MDVHPPVFLLDQVLRLVRNRILHLICNLDAQVLCSFQIDYEVQFIRHRDFHVAGLFAVLQNIRSHLADLVTMIIIFETHRCQSAPFNCFAITGEKGNFIVFRQLDDRIDAADNLIIKRQVEGVHAVNQ